MDNVWHGVMWQVTLTRDGQEESIGLFKNKNSCSEYVEKILNDVVIFDNNTIIRIERRVV